MVICMSYRSIKKESVSTVNQSLYAYDTTGNREIALGTYMHY